MMTQEAAEAQIEALLRSCSSTGSTNRRDFTINWGCFYGWWFPPSHDLGMFWDMAAMNTVPGRRANRCGLPELGGV